MSSDTPPPNDASTSIFETHPVLGRYVSHHPSRREWLLLRALVLYGVAVVILQLVFLTIPDDVEAVVLPFLYMLIALGAFWSVVHLWNREVVLYQQGFTYREGSREGMFLYNQIKRLDPNARRTHYFGLAQRTQYRYMLVTDQDETLYITNLYSETQALTQTLEKFVTQAWREVVMQHFKNGEVVEMGATVQVSRERLIVADAALAWDAYRGYHIQGRRVTIASVADPAWATIALHEIDQPLVFLSLLRQQQAQTQATGVDVPATPRTEEQDI